MSSVVVQKFGGMCLATPEKIKSVAKKVAARRQSGESLIVVVSAMGSTTDELVRQAYQVSQSPDRRELDMLLSTGERVSMALLSMALRDLGCDSISFTGSQAGVFTDSSHSGAKIVDVKPIRLEAELAREKVVVLAGFQGVDPKTKEITTLGRGGSDTTAVAMAAHFRAKACEIYKEVEGLCSADPRLVTPVQRLGEASFDALLDMCFWGAKVLHYRSVELAKTMNVPLFLKFTDDENLGTCILPESTMYENQKVLSLNSHNLIHHLEVVSARDVSDGLAKFDLLLQQFGLAWPQILAATTDHGTVRAMYTSDSEHLSAIERALKLTKEIRPFGAARASVTLTCQGSVASDLARRTTEILQSAGIAVDKILLQPLSLTLILDPRAREKAIQVLHQKLIEVR